MYISELFPPNYTIYRHDREDNYGGAFLACHTTLISYEIPHKIYGQEEIMLLAKLN